MSIKPFSAVKHPQNFFKFRIPCGIFSKYSANMTPLAGVTPAIGRFSNKILGDGNVVLNNSISTSTLTCRADSVGCLQKVSSAANAHILEYHLSVMDTPTLWIIQFFRYYWRFRQELVMGELDIFFLGRARAELFFTYSFLNGLWLDLNFVSSNRAKPGLWQVWLLSDRPPKLCASSL